MKRLFIVGNDAFTVQAMRFALRYSSGVNLFGVIDGQGSVRHAVREAQPDVVVVDAMTDPASAPARVHEIREEAPDAAILLLSGPLGDDALNEVLDAGAMVCLGRSLRLAAVEDAVDHTGNGKSAAVNGAAMLAHLHANGNGNSNGHAKAANEGGIVTPLHANGNGRAAISGNGHGNGHVHAVTNGDGRPAPMEAPACPLTRRELEILRAVAEGHTNARIGRDLWVTEQTVKFHLSNIYRKLGVSNRTEASRYALVNNLFGVPMHGNHATEPGVQAIAARTLSSRADLTA
jgi:DNA-binding NarL/FixJ family response regulator